MRIYQTRPRIVEAIEYSDGAFPEIVKALVVAKQEPSAYGPFIYFNGPRATRAALHPGDFLVREGDEEWTTVQPSKFHSQYEPVCK